MDLFSQTNQLGWSVLRVKTAARVKQARILQATWNARQSLLPRIIQSRARIWSLDSWPKNYQGTLRTAGILSNPLKIKARKKLPARSNAYEKIIYTAEISVWEWETTEVGMKFSYTGEVTCTEQLGPGTTPVSVAVCSHIAEWSCPWSSAQKREPWTWTACKLTAPSIEALTQTPLSSKRTQVNNSSGWSFHQEGASGPALQILFLRLMQKEEWAWAVSLKISW